MLVYGYAKYVLGDLIDASDGELLNSILQQAQDRSQTEVSRLAMLEVAFWHSYRNRAAVLRVAKIIADEKSESISLRALAAHVRNEHSETYGTDLNLFQLAVSQGVTSDVRKYAVIALGRSADPQAVPTLITALEQDDGTLATMIAHSLGEFGADAKEAVPVLCRMVSNKNEDHAAAIAARALASIGQRVDESIPVLLEALDDSSRTSVRVAAVDSLVNLVSESPSETDRVIPALIAVIQENEAGQIGNEELTCTVLNALSKFGDAAGGALPTIRTLLTADSKRIQTVAMLTLKALE